MNYRIKNRNSQSKDIQQFKYSTNLLGRTFSTVKRSENQPNQINQNHRQI